MALWEDNSHYIWIGTWDKGLWKLDPQTKQVEKYLTEGKGILHIHSILEYSPELLFIGSDDGLTIFNPVTKESFLYNNYGDSEKSLSDKFIYPMLKDREGGVWIGTYYNGINYLPPTADNSTATPNPATFLTSTVELSAVSVKEKTEISGLHPMIQD